MANQRIILVMIAFWGRGELNFCMQEQRLTINPQLDGMQTIFNAIDSQDPKGLEEWMRYVHALPEEEQKSVLENISFETINTQINAHSTRHKKKHGSWQKIFSSTLLSSYALTFCLGATSTFLYAIHVDDPHLPAITTGLLGMFAGSLLNYAMLCYDYPRMPAVIQIKHLVATLEKRKNNSID